MKFKDTVTGIEMEPEDGTSRDVIVVGSMVHPVDGVNGWCVVDGSSWGYWLADIGARGAGSLIRIEVRGDVWVVTGDLSEDDAELFCLALSLSQDNGPTHKSPCPTVRVGETVGGLAQ